MKHFQSILATSIGAGLIFSLLILASGPEVTTALPLSSSNSSLPDGTEPLTKRWTHFTIFNDNTYDKITISPKGNDKYCWHLRELEQTLTIKPGEHVEVKTAADNRGPTCGTTHKLRYLALNVKGSSSSPRTLILGSHTLETTVHFNSKYVMYIGECVEDDVGKCVGNVETSSTITPIYGEFFARSVDRCGASTSDKYEELCRQSHLHISTENLYDGQGPKGDANTPLKGEMQYVGWPGLNNQ
eukprot:Nk52_evm26s2449 gene=Nk52_evmTU26s2449